MRRTFLITLPVSITVLILGEKFSSQLHRCVEYLKFPIPSAIAFFSFIAIILIVLAEGVPLKGSILFAIFFSLYFLSLLGITIGFCFLMQTETAFSGFASAHIIFIIIMALLPMYIDYISHKIQKKYTTTVHNDRVTIIKAVNALHKHEKYFAL